MITIEKLDLLNVEEILIFYKLVEEEKKYRTICAEMDLQNDNLAHLVKDICRKLDIFPRKPQQMRIIWRYSVRLNKQSIDVQKQKI